MCVDTHNYITGIPMGGGMRGNGRYNNRGRGNDWNNLGTNEFGYNGMGRRYEPNMFIPGM